MLVQIDKREKEEIRKLKVEVPGMELRITFDSTRGLVINKIGLEENEDVIFVRPYASNEIIIK